ncbi:unnamed protein product [Rotaria sp. Silwood1]|nr:unnamed protein product [Rotaria sp. Silwood1]CAF1555306.1 unnamed protein product [Rotaria sp. Silwood1]CAF3573674.1 unnamed protein product [Rotaria sp. Silwood1]CAF3701419.1 unnamed protein product [Rotaria sp. Silwood1]
MSAQEFYETLQKYQSGPFRVENLDRLTLTNRKIPTYYRIRTIGNHIRIMYWWFYGYQYPCFLNQGAHNGDWEHVMVILTEDRTAVAAVSFYQHSGHYTRIAGPRDAPCAPAGAGRCSGSFGFERSGTHPVVYSGKIAHGSYHDKKIVGLPGPTECAYFGDFRNPKSIDDYLQSWNNLIDLDGDEEAWIIADRTANWAWGPGGITNHPTKRFPDDAEHSVACTGNVNLGVADAACYQSECLSGDEETTSNCVKEWNPKLKVYHRMAKTNAYMYNYILPHQDAGLIRRRNHENEWNLP